MTSKDNTRLKPFLVIETNYLMWPEETIREMVFPDVTGDRIFGYLTRLTLDAFFDPEKIRKASDAIGSVEEGIALIVGTGAALVWQNPDMLIWLVGKFS